MVQGQTDFPVLTRSRRISPEVLQVLRSIETGGVRRATATRHSLTRLDEATLRTLPDIAERALGREHPELATLLHRLAVLYHSQDKVDKAESLYRRALDVAQKAFREPNLELGLIMNNLGRLLYDKKELAEAEKLYRWALEAVEEAVGPRHPKRATLLSNLAKLCLDQNQPALASKMYGESIALLERALGPEHSKVVKAKKKMGRMLEGNVIKTLGVCSECNDVITGIQPWEVFNGRPIHSRCKPSLGEAETHR